MTKVFISHRGADQPPAERLATALRHHGHDVWLDTWKVNVGDSVVEQIDGGLSDASFLVLCYSDDPTAGSWMNREWMSALARQLEGANIRVLPVRLTGGTPPAVLADVKYADLVVDWQGGVEALCKVLR